MTEREWGSLVDSRNEEGFAVGYLPYRKRVCLYHTTPGLIRPMAYFLDEDKAWEFWQWISNFPCVRDLGEAK